MKNKNKVIYDNRMEGFTCSDPSIRASISNSPLILEEIQKLITEQRINSPNINSYFRSVDEAAEPTLNVIQDNSGKIKSYISAFDTNRFTFKYDHTLFRSDSSFHAIDYKMDYKKEMVMDIIPTPGVLILDRVD